MSDKPAIFVEYDPESWQMTAIYLKASTDEEARKLNELLVKGVKCEMPAGGRYDS